MEQVEERGKVSLLPSTMVLSKELLPHLYKIQNVLTQATNIVLQREARIQSKKKGATLEEEKVQFDC